MLELLLLYKKRLPDYVRNSPTKMKWLSETAEKQELRELVEDCLFSIKHVDDTTRRKITDQKGALQEDRVLPSNQEEEDLSSAPGLAKIKKQVEGMGANLSLKGDTADPVDDLLKSGKRSVIEELIWQHRCHLPNRDTSLVGQQRRRLRGALSTFLTFLSSLVLGNSDSSLSCLVFLSLAVTLFTFRSCLSCSARES
eukprot:GHVN01073178.1.p1 GENE.GHVN01073178.1~~GHVN01073178.1.p1  ORF type:complete len:197 (+),score=21.30 GHVN01073178.1:1276-1866(+)